MRRFAEQHDLRIAEPGEESAKGFRCLGRWQSLAMCLYCLGQCGLMRTAMFVGNPIIRHESLLIPKGDGMPFDFKLVGGASRTLTPIKAPLQKHP